MENVIDSLNIALYLLKNVQIQCEDSIVKRGYFSMYDPTAGTLQIDEESIPVDSVKDIEYISVVDDFHNYKAYGEIGNIKFTPEDLHPDFVLSDLLYGEFVCTVSCHLYLKDEEIYAKDIRLLKKRHTLNIDCAKEKNLIYRYDDGSIIIGTVSENSPEEQLINSNGESYPLDLNHIVDITKAPEVNDYLYLRLSTDTMEHSGLVSAVNGTTIVLIGSNGVPEVIDLLSATAIRYRGTFYFKIIAPNGKALKRGMIPIGSSKGDNDYICKLPYTRNPETVTHAKEGDIVSFIAGINDKCFIAKDLNIIQSEAEQKNDSDNEFGYYGIILAVDFSRDNGYGYVGNHFVSKACGQPVYGNARFIKNQLDFKIEHNKMYVVKYTSADNADDNLRIINKISLYKVLDSTKYGIVDVSDDGEISTVPLYRAGSTYFENRDVDIYCVNGSVISGNISSYSDTGINICTNQGSSENLTFIPFTDIDNIRIIGTVSQFYSNGTGYIDRTFFFHINEMEKSIDAQHIHCGMQVSFDLRNSRKGNYVDCGNIRILPEKKIEVYVLSYNEQKYTVVDSEKYGRGIHFFNDAYEIPYYGYNILGNLNHSNYHVIMTIQRKNSLNECTNVRVLKPCPKLRYGIVTALDNKSHTVSIVSPSNYRKSPSAVQYPLSMHARINQIIKPDENDYPVLYYTTIQNGILVAMIDWVESKEIYNKCFFGYIEQFSEEKQFGWITPDEYITTSWKNRPKNFGVYYRLTSLVAKPEAIESQNSNFVLRVCYTLDFDYRITPYGHKPSANKVWILESINHPKFTPSDSAYIPKFAPKEKKTEIKNISDMPAPAAVFADAECQYGLINIFKKNSYALINTQYYNKNYFPDSNYDTDQTVVFVPNETTIIPNPRLKSGNSYLVRYVKKGTIINPATGIEQATIDSSYPVEVICTFSKKECSSIVLNGEELTIEYLVEKIPESNLTDNDAPEFIIGESIYLKLNDGSACHGIYSGENDTSYFLSNGNIIDKDTILRLFRFGVISALNIENGTARINNYFDFNLTVAEPKMLSILKNQKNLVRLHIMYSCVQGKITEVCRISKRCLSCLAWEPGTVTELDEATNSIIIDSSIRHYLTVMSDGVNVYVNNDTILNRAVFVKQVFHPYLGENEEVKPCITASAVDVRCQEEDLRIQYDEGRDVYVGCRNATISFPIMGSSRVLHERIGDVITVMFRVSSDMYNLEGYINDDSGETTEEPDLSEEFNSAKISDESLSLLLLQKEDIGQLGTRKICLDADSDQSQVQRAVDFFIGKSRQLAAIKVAMEYPQYDVLAKTENLFRSEMQKRCNAVCLDPNSYNGEQAFYIATTLQYPTSSKTRSRFTNNRFSNYDFLYRLFSQDFEGREQLANYLKTGNPARKANLVNLFRRSCLQIEELVAHLVLLNKLNLDTICSLIQENKQLSDQIVMYAKEVDDTISEKTIPLVIAALQDRYLRDKRRFTDGIIALISRENICEDLKKILINMQSRFLKLTCKEDRQRFESLLNICLDVLGYTNKPGFTQQEQQLLHAYRDINMLEEDILAHPCKESVEILLTSGRFDISANILETVKKDIFSILNRLYKDASRPRIQCRLNENSILPEAKTFWLIVENGSQNENLQPAENLQIELEPFTLGFMPQTKVHLLQNKLSCGEQRAVEVEFDLSEDAPEVLEFGWTASYEYTTDFLSDGNTSCSAYLQESEHPLQLQINAASAETKKTDVDNPYFDPARGQPLIGKEMFFGRKAEKKKILECICTSGEKKRFIPGSAVIIHGQKKSGKTSLVNQIKNYIKEDAELSERAILLNFSNILTDTGGVQQLECFQRTFYTAIMSRFKHEIKRCHPDVSKMLKDNDIIIPSLLHPDYRDTWPVAFDAFFQDFYSVDKGKHTILLFMDEFTLLCTTILSEVQRFPEKASLNNIPNFIKTFSQYGFIQIIIGHEAMMRALNTLGVLNHTAEFAKSIEISALDEDAARALVTQPMIDKFGYNVYDSELGKQAVDRLLDLSGCNPAYLMRLCSKMFMYYTDPIKCPRTQILISDVNAMVQEYTSELLLSDFDILLMEDGDDAIEVEKRITYRFLKCAALLSLSSYDKRTADSSEITRELSNNFDYTVARIEMTRNVLEARRIISITNGGRVRINTGLFSEYIQQKNGLK